MEYKKGEVVNPLTLITILDMVVMRHKIEVANPRDQAWEIHEAQSTQPLKLTYKVNYLVILIQLFIKNIIKKIHK